MKREELAVRLRVPYAPKRGCGLARTPEPGYENIWFVVPAPPPRTPPSALPLKALAKASEVLARQKEFSALDGVDKLIGYYFVRREAVESSRIEGTWSTIDHVLTPGEERGAGAAGDARLSVRGYAHALETRLALAARERERIFTLKTVLGLHRDIVAKDPGYRGEAGALRAPGRPGSVVQIGGSFRKEDSTYNPAPPRFVASSLRAVLDWLSDEGLAERGDAGVGGFTLPVRLAVAHAHFEAVHPFSDGNGRVGRALWPLQMACAGRAPLYLSGFVEAHRDDYGRALQAAQKRLSYSELVEFVCEAVLRSDAESAASRAAIAALPGRWRSRARFRGGSTALRALDLFQRMPIATIAMLTEELGVTKQAARVALDQLVERGVVRNRGRAGRTQLFAAEELISLLSRPFGSDAEAALKAGRALLAAWALVLALALPAFAESPAAAVDRVMTRVGKLVAAQSGKDAWERRDLDRRAEGLYKDIKPLGWKAAPALAAAASDLKRPGKVRLFAVSFLALIQDPAAFPPLEDILLNPEQDPDVRGLAAQSLPGQGAPDASVSKALCAVLAQKDLPREVLDDAMMSLGRYGCVDPAPLVRLARSFGPRPDAKDLPVVAAALGALGRSRGAASGRELLALVRWFPARGDARAAAIKALDARRAEVADWLAPEALPVVAEALRSESERWDAMLPLIRLASALGPDAGPALARLSNHPDAEVLAEAAEAMVLYKRVEAIPDLEAVLAGAMKDPRFSPKEGRPDPAALLARIEKAVDALRRAR